MNNTPKFRAWHKESKKMCKVHKMNFNDDGEVVSLYLKVPEIPHPYYTEVKADNIELMQWIGLNDANKKEIYENDILIYHNGGGVDTYMIERSIYNWQLQARYLYFPGNNIEYLEETPTDSSIIVGNIYENSELLKNANQ